MRRILNYFATVLPVKKNRAKCSLIDRRESLGALAQGVREIGKNNVAIGCHSLSRCQSDNNNVYVGVNMDTFGMRRLKNEKE